MTHVMSNWSHACHKLCAHDWFEGFDWLKDVAQLTQVSLLMDFIL